MMLDARATPVRQVPGEAGAWVFIFGDLAAFTVLFGAYLNRRSLDLVGFDEAQLALDRTIGALNTVVLLSSSLFVARALDAFRRGDRPRAGRLVGFGWLCGATFVVVKVFEYHHLTSAGKGPNTHEFYMFYFVLTGLHLFHVLLGLAVLAVLWCLTRRAATTGAQQWFATGACFWHLVDLLWVVIFPLIFLVR